MSFDFSVAQNICPFLSNRSSLKAGPTAYSFGRMRDRKPRNPNKLFLIPLGKINFFHGIIIF